MTKQAIPKRIDMGVHTELLVMTLPLLVFAVYLYGARSAALYCTAVLTANLCDRAVAFLRHRPYEADELSSEAFAAMLALLMPVTVSYRVLILSVLACDLLGKEVFGGYSCYIFHPTCVGYAVAAISWPEQIGRYPMPGTRVPVWGGTMPNLTSSVSDVLRHKGMPSVSPLNFFIGNYPGSLGGTAALITIAVALLLICRRRLPLAALAGFAGTCMLVFWCFPRAEVLAGVPPFEEAKLHALAVMYEMFSGAIPLAAVFFLSDPHTVPKNNVSRLIFGIMLGISTVLFRYYGNYDCGVCFPMLILNCYSGWMDRVVHYLLGHSPERGNGL